MTELQKPLAVRRAVSFCEAVYTKRKVVEGVEAVLIKELSEIKDTWNLGKIPIIVAPEINFQKKINPDVMIEATVSKRNTGINIKDAPLVIALGPGYMAGSDAHFVVETKRGHDLARLITDGYAKLNPKHLCTFHYYLLTWRE